MKCPPSILRDLLQEGAKHAVDAAGGEAALAFAAAEAAGDLPAEAAAALAAVDAVVFQVERNGADPQLLDEVAAELAAAFEDLPAVLFGGHTRGDVVVA